MLKYNNAKKGKGPFSVGQITTEVYPGARGVGFLCFGQKEHY